MESRSKVAVKVEPMQATLAAQPGSSNTETQSIKTHLHRIKTALKKCRANLQLDGPEPESDTQAGMEDVMDLGGETMDDAQGQVFFQQISNDLSEIFESVHSLELDLLSRQTTLRSKSTQNEVQLNDDNSEPKDQPAIAPENHSSGPCSCAGRTDAMLKVQEATARIEARLSQLFPPQDDVEQAVGSVRAQTEATASSSDPDEESSDDEQAPETPGQVALVLDQSNEEPEKPSQELVAKVQGILDVLVKLADSQKQDPKNRTTTSVDANAILQNSILQAVKAIPNAIATQTKNLQDTHELKQDQVLTGMKLQSELTKISLERINQNITRMNETLNTINVKPQPGRLISLDGLELVPKLQLESGRENFKIWSLSLFGFLRLHSAALDHLRMQEHDVEMNKAALKKRTKNYDEDLDAELASIVLFTISREVYSSAITPAAAGKKKWWSGVLFMQAIIAHFKSNYYSGATF
ncbi:hypothetical protein A4X13_0g189 [Tilletia indica]|uniref:Uncharacterized protein n=1 Tax=Tilletia indica TaxID=43049 RepID=A0A177TK76_9BASI|nr:hypothetical protein A4X13_0g189 [Tilletia indica]